MLKPVPETIATLKAHWLDLRQQMIRRLDETPRSGFGVVAILALILAWLALLMADLNSAFEKDIVARDQRLKRLEIIAGETNWAERRQLQEAQTSQLESRLWPAESEGIAVAGFQDWLSAEARQAGMPGVVVRAELTPPDAAGPRRLQASLYGTFQAQQLEQYLATLQKYPAIIRVDRLRIQTNPVPRFDLIVSTFLRDGPPA